MSQFQIQGGHPLKGSVTISGRKNAALKLLAASLLSDHLVKLHRIPDIGDVQIMLQILQEMGAKLKMLEVGSYEIDTRSVINPIIPTILGRKLRASLVLVGPLLARFGQATFPHPGGCVIGKRSILPHLAAFERLGAQIKFDGTTYTISSQKLQGAEIYLKEQSVTGTENLMMAATRLEGITTIYSAAEEPHIVNLANLLRKMGYDISGDGTSKVIITGHPEGSTKDAVEDCIADDIEVGTFAVAAIITNGTVTLKEVGPRLDLYPILSKLDDFQVNYRYDEEKQTLDFFPNSKLKASPIQTRPWPGFPSDMQSPFTVLATQSEGTSLIHDWMYEGRLYFVSSLQSMGANINVCDPHRVLVTGPTPLYHSTFITPDLRAGAALVLATLIAKGESCIEHAELIERGYANLDQRLAKLGAVINREA